MEEWINIGLRTAAFFVLLLITVPLLARKPISGMTVLDNILVWVAAVMVGLIILNVVENLANGLVGIILWIVLIAAFQFLAIKSKWVHDHVYGKETVVVKEGKVMEENLEQSRLTPQELLSQLRKNNIFQLSDVEFAVMETNGDMSVLLKRDKQPITPKDMRIQTSTVKEPQTIILDGNILYEPLASAGLDRGWLMTELEKTGVSVDNVFIGQVDSMGGLYMDLFDDSIQNPKHTSKELLLATLKKVESDFLGYTLETEDDEWKKNYKIYAEEIKKVIDELEPHLKT